jgi:DNA-directed RNA polymerase specialized sigma24 family protein
LEREVIMAVVNTTPSNEEWFADALPIVAARVRAVLRGHYDSELAKDLTQAVLTHVWAVRDTYSGTGPRAAWVFWVARHEAVRLAKEEAGIRNTTVPVEGQGADDYGTPGDNYPSPAEQERHADNARLAKLAEVMLFALVEECRDIANAQDILIHVSELRWLEVSGSLKTELQRRLDLDGSAYQTALQGIRRAADRLADRHSEPNYVNLYRAMMFGLEE